MVIHIYQLVCIVTLYFIRIHYIHINMYTVTHMLHTQNSKTLHTPPVNYHASYQPTSLKTHIHRLIELYQPKHYLKKIKTITFSIIKYYISLLEYNNIHIWKFRHLMNNNHLYIYSGKHYSIYLEIKKYKVHAKGILIYIVSTIKKIFCVYFIYVIIIIIISHR